MSVASLATQLVTIVHRERAAGDDESYGDDVLVETSRVDVRARLHQSTSDDDERFQATTTSRWRLTLAGDVALGPDDLVLVDGWTFSIDGYPYRARRASLWSPVHHVEAALAEVHG